MFTKAIVRTPCQNMINGISSANLGKPDYPLAIIQHQNYIEALQSCGLFVITLVPNERFPDSCFVEDTAVLNERFAVVDKPGAPTRQGEEKAIHHELLNHYSDIFEIEPPGTLEGGDVMRIENNYYVGLSKRTNKEGFFQFQNLCKLFGFDAISVEMKEMLHLKTGVNYLGDNTLLVAGEFIDRKEFQDYNKIIVEKSERYAANCLRINEWIIMPKGFPKLYSEILNLGYKIIELEMSEFQKLDGGLSCLSLRF